MNGQLIVRTKKMDKLMPKLGITSQYIDIDTHGITFHFNLEVDFFFLVIFNYISLFLVLLIYKLCIYDIRYYSVPI